MAGVERRLPAPWVPGSKQPALGNYRRTSRVCLLAGCALFLLLAVPGWIWASLGTHKSVFDPMLAYIVSAYSGMRILQIGASGKKRPSQLIFWLFAYIFLGLCGIAQAGTRRFPWGGQYSSSSIFHAFVIVIISLVAFDVGRLMLSGRRRSQGQVASRWQLKPHRLALLAPLVIGLTTVSVSKMGGVAALFLSRLDLSTSLASNMSSPEATFYRHMAMTPIATLFLLTILHLATLRRNRPRSAWICLALLLGGVTFLVNNPLSTPRFQLGAIVLGVLFALPWSPVRSLQLVLTMVIGMLAVFPLADAFRVSTDVTLAAELAESSGVVNGLAENADFDALQQLINAVVVTGNDGTRHGAQVGGALLFWVPRSLWPDKPVATGYYLAEGMGYRFQNLSAPLWAEFYVDGMHAVLLLGFWLLGIVLARLDATVEASASGGSPLNLASALSILFASYLFFILRGSLMPAIAYLTLPVLVVAAVCFPRIRVGRS